MSKPRVIAIVGPTASGKSDLAVKLAKKFNGEIISADSRQVYKGLDIGAGKITKKEMQGIPHHLLDVANPKKQFTVVDFKKLADKAISDIISRKKLPIICGGTGFYIQAVVDNIILPDVPVNKTLRKLLEHKTAEKIFEILQKTDPKRAKEINKYNKVRLIRAIEIAMVLGKVPPIKSDPQYEVLQIGIKTDQEQLKKKISTRLLARVSNGMITEARKLHTAGLSWKRMEQLGLEYRYLALFLQKKITKKEMIERLTFEILHYAKRQITWFKRDQRIKWFELKESKKIEGEIKKFLV